MTVVAFLQNQWVRDPVRVKALLDKNGEKWRLTFIRFALFRGCLTGRRIKAAFGEEIDTDIIWEETSREIGSKASAYFPADHKHIINVLKLYKPELVIAFGTSATKALKQLWSGKLITGPHPAARGSHVKGELNRMALELRNLISYTKRDECSENRSCSQV